MANQSLAFLESGEYTDSIGAFNNANEESGFDASFESAVKDLEAEKINYFTDILEIVKHPEVMAAFKESALAGIKADCDARSNASEFGAYSNTYNQVDKLWDNCFGDFVKESARLGTLIPIKMIDFPILVKQHVALATKDIIQTEIVNNPVIKKQIEQVWIIDDKTKKRWRYPQCFYTGEYKEVYAAGKGLPIKNDPVALPINDYDIITNLTDATVPGRENFTIDLHIAKVVVGEGANEVEIPVNMYINLHTNQWQNGVIDVEIEGTQYKDKLFGGVDFISNTVTVVSSTGVVKKVIFEGNLSNEKNERTVSFDYTREEREWKIEDGHRVDIPYSIEELDDHKALLQMDLYKKTYDNMAEYLTQMEDSQVLDFLDAEFIKNEGLELDPLQWNSMVKFQDFNCDSTTKTTALPSEFIEKQLKWTIDRFLISFTDQIKMENMSFVIYGNPKYISLLGKNVNWVLSSGSTTGGIKHNYSYGIMNTANVKVQVVSALKFDSKNEYHQGLRVVPIALDKEQMTFRHYKYTTHILTAKDSDYRAADRPGGSYVNLMGTSRYTNAVVQGLQGLITFSNAEFLDPSSTRI